MLFFTGDTHANFRRFSLQNFPQQIHLTRADKVLIAGDFGGIWEQTEPHPLRPERDRLKALKNENWWLDWLNSKPYETCFVLGNHENWDRFDRDEFPVVDYYGGKAHQIRERVYHLISGYVFNFDGVTVFAFGGGQSHDIQDGILRRYGKTDEEYKRQYKSLVRSGARFRVAGVEWWQRECIPSHQEAFRAWENLERHDFKVDLVLTHCLPASLCLYQDDSPLSELLQEIYERIDFSKWICGHYHMDEEMGRFQIVYKKIYAVGPLGL